MTTKEADSMRAMRFRMMNSDRASRVDFLFEYKALLKGGSTKDLEHRDGGCFARLREHPKRFELGMVSSESDQDGEKEFCSKRWRMY